MLRGIKRDGLGCEPFVSVKPVGAEIGWDYIAWPPGHCDLAVQNYVPCYVDTTRCPTVQVEAIDHFPDLNHITARLPVHQGACYAVARYGDHWPIDADPAKAQGMPARHPGGLPDEFQPSGLIERRPRHGS